MYLVSTSRGWLVPAPKTTGCPPLHIAQNVPSPSAVPAQPVSHPARTQTLRAFPNPLLALLPSKRNRLHLARLPRRPGAAGAQPREWVCVEACSHTEAPTTPPLEEGGVLDPTVRTCEVPSARRRSQPDLSETGARLLAGWVTKSI